MSPVSILITAGPTREAVDDVRYLSNRSTGRMGIDIAREAARRGHRVTLVLGPTALTPPEGVEVIRVESAADMLAAVSPRFASCGVFIASAAVADYTPAQRISGKIKKTQGPMSLELVRTVDILANCGRIRRDDQLLVGFALEAGADPLKAREKLLAKQCDIMVHNMPDNFGDGTGRVTIMNTSETLWQGVASKATVATRLLDAVESKLAARAA